MNIDEVRKAMQEALNRIYNDVENAMRDMETDQGFLYAMERVPYGHLWIAISDIVGVSDARKLYILVQENYLDNDYAWLVPGIYDMLRAGTLGAVVLEAAERQLLKDLYLTYSVQKINQDIQTAFVSLTQHIEDFLAQMDEAIDIARGKYDKRQAYIHEWPRAPRSTVAHSLSHAQRRYWVHYKARDKLPCPGRKPSAKAARTRKDSENGGQRHAEKQKAGAGGHRGCH